MSCIAKNDMTPLPSSFKPGPYTVICARGKEAKNHEGNRRYKALIQNFLYQYAQANTKAQKSIIVSEIVEFIRGNSPEGGFVKQDEASGIWYEVSTHHAKEKTSQVFRDSLHLKYKSSTKAKKRRRDAMKETTVLVPNSAAMNHSMKLDMNTNIMSVQQLPHMSSSLSPTTTPLLPMQYEVMGSNNSNKCHRKNHSNDLPDLFVSHIYAKAHLQVLETMKREQELFNKFTARNTQFLKMSTLY